jgi:hypothetical protein
MSAQKGDLTMEGLTIIASNDHPKRENEYPQTWVLYKQDNTVEVRVIHDRLNRPFVCDKTAA